VLIVSYKYSQIAKHNKYVESVEILTQTYTHTNSWYMMMLGLNYRYLTGIEISLQVTLPLLVCQHCYTSLHAAATCGLWSVVEASLVSWPSVVTKNRLISVVLFVFSVVCFLSCI